MHAIRPSDVSSILITCTIRHTKRKGQDKYLMQIHGRKKGLSVSAMPRSMKDLKTSFLVFQGDVPCGERISGMEQVFIINLHLTKS